MQRAVFIIQDAQDMTRGTQEAVGNQVRLVSHTPQPDVWTSSASPLGIEARGKGVS